MPLAVLYACYITDHSVFKDTLAFREARPGFSNVHAGHSCSISFPVSFYSLIIIQGRDWSGDCWFQYFWKCTFTRLGAWLCTMYCELTQAGLSSQVDTPPYPATALADRKQIFLTSDIWKFEGHISLNDFDTSTICLVWECEKHCFNLHTKYGTNLWFLVTCKPSLICIDSHYDRFKSFWVSVSQKNVWIDSSGKKNKLGWKVQQPRALPPIPSSSA